MPSILKISATFALIAVSSLQSVASSSMAARAFNKRNSPGQSPEEVQSVTSHSVTTLGSQEGHASKSSTKRPASESTKKRPASGSSESISTSALPSKNSGSKDDAEQSESNDSEKKSKGNDSDKESKGKDSEKKSAAPDSTEEVAAVGGTGIPTEEVEVASEAEETQHEA